MTAPFQYRVHRFFTLHKQLEEVDIAKMSKKKSDEMSKEL